jgi:hypothetical protein
MKPALDRDKGYSPEVAGILDRKPAWIIRYGMLVVGFIFALGLAGTWFIPYPQRLNCIATFPDPAESSGSESTFAGIISLPNDCDAIVREGMPVKIALASTGNSDLRSTVGIISTIHPDSLADNLSVTVMFRTDPETATFFISANHCNAQITTGRSNLLQQIFNPVIALLKGTQNNQK